MKQTKDLNWSVPSRRQMLMGDGARAALIAGIDSLAMLLRPTLGPLARRVAVESLLPGRPPELLDDAATIARRVEQLPDPFEDMGAMLLRQMVWSVRESVGDGAATATVIAHSLVKQAHPYIISGGDPTELGSEIARAADVVVEHLRGIAASIGSNFALKDVVAGAIRESQVASVVAEAVEAVGADGTVRIEKGYLNGAISEYAEGTQWPEGVLSPSFLPAVQSEVRLLEPAVLSTSQPLDETAQLLPVLEACLSGGYRSLFLITPALSGPALKLLITNTERRVFDRIIVVKAPSSGFEQQQVLEDIAVLTGGRFFSKERGDRLQDIQAEHFGRAQEVWATRRTFGIEGGRGSRDAIRARVVEARAQLVRQHGQDVTLDRIVRLTGLSAVIHVGAATEIERAELQPRVEAAVKSAQAALRAGVLPGGGAALAAGGFVLKEMEGVPLRGSTGSQMLARALAEPMRAISENAGLDAGLIVDEATRRGIPWTFDVVRQDWVIGTTSGPVDALSVVQASLQAAVELATTVISMEGLVRRQRPPVAINP